MRNNTFPYLHLLTVDRPSSAGKRAAVFILCSGKDSTLDAIGTAFAVNGHCIVTCAHNVAMKKRGTLLTECMLVDKVTRFPSGDQFSENPIQIELVKYNVLDDWAVYRRTDGDLFRTFLEVEMTLPEPSSNLYFTIYHAPLSLLNGELNSVSVSSERTTLMLYDDEVSEKNGERTIIKRRYFISTDGKCSGSSGSPIVCDNGKVIAFHTASFDESPRLTEENLKSVKGKNVESRPGSEIPTSYRGHSHASIISALSDLLLCINTTGNLLDTSSKIVALGHRPDRKCKHK